MREPGRAYCLTMLIISDDLAVMRQIADRMLILNARKVIEQARTR